MFRRLVINDIKANRLTAAATCVFMAVTAMLLGLSTVLFAGLSSSVDSLMKKAMTPDFLQMHTGEADGERLAAFARLRSDVDQMQICSFLNLPNSRLSVGGRTFDGNMQDNGLCCQSERFDYLLDPENKIIRPSEGEVYVPVCYRREYGILPGEVMRIGAEELTVAGFLRDSQMNSMMASSKRFLVSGEDYERLKDLGSEEYLIEFRLKEGSDLNAFATAYRDAGLPSNGPTITYPLIRMMNALSDGIMILIILLVSAVVLFISAVSIRYIILTQLEKDRREIGMLKAVGISKTDIRRLYLSKYLLLSACGCVAGTAAAAVLAGPLGTQMRELYGEADSAGFVRICMVLGAVLAEGILLLTVYRTLGRTEKISAVEALRGQGGGNDGGFGRRGGRRAAGSRRAIGARRRNLWIPVFAVTAAAVFMILVPQSIRSTLTAPEFATCMGIGNSRIRIDVRQADGIEESVQTLAKELERDARVADYAVMTTRSYQAVLSGGKTYRLMVENGDHGRFPVTYTEGRYPENENEIALSLLNAGELGLKTGDTLTILKETENGRTERTACTVCGIYSDVTNGGKTAKGCIRGEDDRTPVMWSILYVSLTDEGLNREWVADYQQRYADSDGGIKAAVIEDYLKATYGQVIGNVTGAYLVTAALACAVVFAVVLLLARLVIWRERGESSLKKALGFTSSDIRRAYLKKALLYILPGAAAGVFAGLYPGQWLAGLLLGSMGAQGFQFIVDPVSTFLFVPALVTCTAAAAAAAGLAEIRRIRAEECLRTGTE